MLKLFLATKIVTTLALGVLIGQAIFITINWNTYQARYIQRSTPAPPNCPLNEPRNDLNTKEVQSVVNEEIKDTEDNFLNHKATSE